MRYGVTIQHPHPNGRRELVQVCHKYLLQEQIANNQFVIEFFNDQRLENFKNEGEMHRLLYHLLVVELLSDKFVLTEGEPSLTGH